MTIDKNRCLELIKLAITPPDSKVVWKNDPFEFLLEKLKNSLSENDLEYLFSSLDETSDTAVPSTSTCENLKSSEIESSTLNNDARIKYSQVLGRLYLELASHLNSEKTTAEDEYRLVSLQDLNTINESFQFFILTGVLPFLEPGVGMPASSRSNFVKSWKLYNKDVYAQTKQLSNAANVILDLLESNEAVRGQLMKKFIDDLLAIRYQLLDLPIHSFESRFAKLLDEAPRDLMLSALMGLCRPKAGKPEAPEFLKKLSGAALTECLMKKDGLFHFIAYFTDSAGETWTDNLPLRKFVANQLARVPRTVKSSLAYHSNIFGQFLELIENSKSEENRKLFGLFVAFVSEMSVPKYVHNADLVIFDHFLRFWEVVAEKMSAEVYHTEKIETFERSAIQSLKILAKMMKLGGFSGNERILKICRVFIELTDQDEQVAEVSEAAKNILKGLMKNMENPGELLYSIVMEDSRQLRIVEEKEKGKIMIEEIGEETKETDGKDFNLQLWIDAMEEPDIGVARRLENVCEILNDVFDKKAVNVLLEMLAKGVENWRISSKKEDDNDVGGMRFVGLDSEPRNNSLHAHLVVGFCFEQMATLISKDGFVENDARQLILLLKIVENVLSKTTKTLDELHIRNQEVDILRLSDAELGALETMVETSKLCIGLASGVVIAASFQPEILDNLEKTLKIMKEFVLSARKCVGYVGNLKVVADDANKLLEVMNLDLKPDQQPSTSKEEFGGTPKKPRHACVCDDIITDLRNENEEVAVRGGALIQTSTIFRKNNKKLIEKFISMDIFEVVKGLVNHPDSYIYLSAINCLGEIACYDRKYLQNLIELYSDMGNSSDEKPQNTEAVVRRGRFGEALGKIFRSIGEVSVLYLDQIAAVFVNGIREEEEIIRASCCCALGDVVLASRGRGIEKLLDEMLYLLDSLILIDKSALVRRAAVDLVRQCIKSCSTDVLQIMGGRLRDIRRKVVSLWKYDRDEVVRLHAQLCIEELKSAMDDILEEENSRYCRTIRI